MIKHNYYHSHRILFWLMKADSISNIRTELRQTERADLIELCLKLARFKKENKEYLSYLLFQSNNELYFIEKAKEEIKTMFQEIVYSHPFYTKKGLRKIIRNMDKIIRFSGKPATEVELRVSFCENYLEAKKKMKKPETYLLLFERQIIKIGTALTNLHEDIQFDYKERLNTILQTREKKNA